MTVDRQLQRYNDLRPILDGDLDVADAFLSTYLRVDDPPLELQARCHALAEFLDRRDAGVALAAELKALSRHADEPTRTAAELKQLLADVEIEGPRPVRVEFTRDGEAVVLLGSLVHLQDLSGVTQTFVVVPLAAFEGERSRPYDPLALLPGAPTRYTIEGVSDAQVTRLGALNRRLNVVLLSPTSPPTSRACDLDAREVRGDAMPRQAVTWVRVGDESVWCHVVPPGGPPRGDPDVQEVMPVIAAADLKWTPPGDREKIGFPGARVHGWLCGLRFIPRPALVRLAQRAVVARMPLLDRLRHALRALLGPAAGGPADLKVGERILDWFYDDDVGFAAALRIELLLGLAIFSAGALAVFLAAAALVARVLPPPYLAIDLAEQVRMGSGVLVTLAAGVPLLFRIHAALPGIWVIGAAGTAALAACSWLGVEYTAPIAAAMTGAQFGVAAAALSKEKPATDPAAPRAIDWSAVARSGSAVGGAATIVLLGYVITQWHPFRGQALPIGIAVTLLVFLLTAGHHRLLLLFNDARFELRKFLARFVAVALATSGLIWLGIAMAEDPATSRVLEGVLFGGLASVLLLAFLPVHRQASAAALSTFWTWVFPLALALVLLLVALSKPEVYPQRLSSAFIAFIAAFPVARVLTATLLDRKRGE